ncbi:MAG: J domain-containing protein [Eubacteriales bacterium]|nr:J domain-containing protein [Eubacteriales bacterium]
MTRDEALKILGLEEGANLYEIEKRYSLLSRSFIHEDRQQVEEKIRRVVEAYDFLTGKSTVWTPEPEPMGARRFLGKTKREWRNWADYAYRPILVVLVLIAVFASILHSALTTKQADLELAYVGAFAALDPLAAELDFNLLDESELWESKKISIDFLACYQGIDFRSEQATLMRMSLIASGAANCDLMILDRPMFDRYVEHGLFRQIDMSSLSPEEAEAFSSLEPIQAEVKEEDESGAIQVLERGTYGLASRRQEDFAALGIYGREYIFAFPRSAKHFDLAEQYLLDMLSSRARLRDAYAELLKSAHSEDRPPARKE